eukprot:TRINITY_DN845_c1_g1_i1.p1 TRINITY_DN845_c1_g1~~TRINITY_DN845_c1_g1_i1.p1  ORF type:complete len:278 (+),score=75.34 TRINITY_DN845_c1_g1_i1:67-834(+)
MLRLALVTVLSAFAVASKPTATALHILMKSENELVEVQNKIADGEATFEDMAEQHSTCPSGKKGGSLGNFGKGSMVKEFDAVVFDPKTELDKVYGPVKTQFGYHLIKVTERSGTAKKKKKKTSSVKLNSMNEFTTTVLESKEAFAVEFYSNMCGSCKEFGPVWDEYAAGNPPVRTAKVDIDSKGAKEIADTLGVMEEGIPNVRVFSGVDETGTSIMKGDPLKPHDLKTKIQEALKPLKKKGKKTGIYRKINRGGD